MNYMVVLLKKIKKKIMSNKMTYFIMKKFKTIKNK